MSHLLKALDKAASDRSVDQDTDGKMPVVDESWQEPGDLSEYLPIVGLLSGLAVLAVLVVLAWSQLRSASPVVETNPAPQHAVALQQPSAQSTAPVTPSNPVPQQPSVPVAELAISKEITPSSETLLPTTPISTQTPPSSPPSADVEGLLPKMNVGGHIFVASRPRLGRVFVDGVAWRAGDTLANGVMVKEVREFSVLFSYRGHDHDVAIEESP